jgi:hypothetical protein
MMERAKNKAPDIEKLRQQYENLNTKRITAKANLTTSNQTLERLKKEAREKYGTDDLASLRAKLEAMTQDNERKRAEYQEHLTAIEGQLAEVEAHQSQTASNETQA